MEGWIKVHRELLEKPIWTESTPEQKTILITLLMMANHSQKEWEWKGERYKAEPGQFVTSLPSIVKKCGKGITLQNVRTAIKRFEKYNFLTDESTNKNRLITIVNWGLYQRKDNEDNVQPNRQLTGDQQAGNRQLTPNKNVRITELKSSSRARVFQIYESHFGMPSVNEAEKIHSWIDDLGEEMVIEAMRIAYKKDKLFWGFAEGVLREWVRKGYKSVLDIEVERTSKREKSEDQMDNIEILAKYAKEKYGIERLPDII